MLIPTIVTNLCWSQIIRILVCTMLDFTTNRALLNVPRGLLFDKHIPFKSLIQLFSKVLQQSILYFSNYLSIQISISKTLIKIFLLKKIFKISLMSGSQDPLANLNRITNSNNGINSQNSDAQRNNRISKIVMKGDEATLRMAKSGSVKAKLNLENNIFRTNLENLNTTVKLQKQNQAHLDKQIIKYKEKLKKYKDRNKQKDQLIAKLIAKIQFNNLQNLQVSESDNKKIDFYFQQINQYKNAVNHGNQIDIKAILATYQQLIKDFKDHSKIIASLQADKKQHIDIINNLRKQLRKLAQENKVQYLQKQNGTEHMNQDPLNQQNNFEKYRSLLRQQKQSRLYLWEKLKQNNIQVDQKFQDSIQALQNRYGQPSNLFVERQNNILHSQLARERQINRELQSQLKSNQNYIAQASDKMNIIQQNIQTLQQHIYHAIQLQKNVLDKLPQKQSEQSKINELLMQIEQEKAKFQILLQKREKDIEEWRSIESTLNQRFDHIILSKRNLQEKLQLQKIMRRKLQLLLLPSNPDSQQCASLNPSQEYVTEKVEFLKKQSEANRQQNNYLKHQLILTQQKLHNLSGQYQKLEQKLKFLNQKLRLTTSVQTKSQIQYGTINQDQKVKKLYQTSAETDYVLSLDSQPGREHYKKLAHNYKQLIKRLQQINSNKSSLSIQKRNQIQTVIQRQDHQDHDESQDMIEDSYKNINQQIQRLTLKCERLQKTKNIIDIESKQEIKKLQNEIEGLREKNRILQKINLDLTNLIIHLEGEANKVKDNNDNSSSGLRASFDSDTIQNKLFQLKRMTERHAQLTSGKQLIEQEQRQLRQLDQKIKNFNRQLQDSFSGSKKGQSIEKSQEKQQKNKCPNCFNLLEANIDLITKNRNLELQKTQKHETLKANLELIKKQSTQQIIDPEIIRQKFYEMKQKFLVYESESSVIQKNAIKQEQQLTKTKQFVNKLIQRVNEQEAQNVKLKTDLYRNNQGDTSQQEKLRFANIIEQLDNKLKLLSEEIQSKQSDTRSKDELYQAINYLNQENQIKKREINYLKQLLDKGGIKQPEDKGDTYNISFKLLEEKYQKLQKQIYDKNQKLFTEKEYQQQNNEKESIIEELTSQIVMMDLQNRNLKKQRQILQEQIKKMGVQLNQIEDMITQLLKQDESMFQLQKIKQKIEESRVKVDSGYNFTNIDSEISPQRYKEMQQKIQKKFQQSQQQLNFLRKRIVQFCKIIQSANKKQKPFLIGLQDSDDSGLKNLILLFHEWLQSIWALVEERTIQFNDLADEMNLISIECFKNQKLDNQMDDPDTSKSKDHQFIQERYEQVLAQLVEYQNLNKKLEQKVRNLTMQLNNYKTELQEVHLKFLSQLKSESSSENLPYNEQILKKIFDGETKLNQIVPQQPLQIVRLLLTRIKQLQEKFLIFQGQLQEKNEKFDELLKKQISIQSQRSGKVKQMQKSNASEYQEVKKINKDLYASDEKSLSVIHSAQIFRQIEQLTRFNQQIRERGEKQQKNIILAYQKLQETLKQQTLEDIKLSLSNVKNILSELVTDIHSQNYKDNILISSRDENKQPFSEFKASLQGLKFNVTVNENKKFIDENKFILNELLDKIREKENKGFQFESVKNIISKVFTGEQLQEIFYLYETDKAIERLLAALQSSFTSEVGHQQSWVEGHDIDNIISKIYPTRSQLCILISTSLEELLSAETGHGILKAIQKLFMSLRTKQRELQESLHQKDSVMTEYAKKMNKILASKQLESGSSIGQLAYQAPFKKTNEIRSEYQIKKQRQEEGMSEENDEQ